MERNKDLKFAIAIVLNGMDLTSISFRRLPINVYLKYPAGTQLVMAKPAANSNPNIPTFIPCPL